MPRARRAASTSTWWPLECDHTPRCAVTASRRARRPETSPHSPYDDEPVLPPRTESERLGKQVRRYRCGRTPGASTDHRHTPACAARSGSARLAASRNPVFVHMGERVPVEMPALTSVLNPAPTHDRWAGSTTCHIGNYGVQLHVKSGNIVGGNTAAQASSDVRASFQRTVRLDGAAETDSPRRKCTEGAANAQWQLDRRRGEAARRLSPERGERSRAVGAGGDVIFATEAVAVPTRACWQRESSSRRSRQSASTGPTARCATRSGTRSASRSHRTGQASRRPRRNCRRRPDECPRSRTRSVLNLTRDQR